MEFEGLRIFFSHWGLEWGSAGALKYLKIQVFLIGDRNWGTAGDALALSPPARQGPKRVHKIPHPLQPKQKRGGVAQVLVGSHLRLRRCGTSTSPKQTILASRGRRRHG
jgi:hypothetical protein